MQWMMVDLRRFGPPNHRKVRFFLIHYTLISSSDDGKDAYRQLLRREMLGFKSPVKSGTERAADGRVVRSADRGRVIQCTVSVDEEVEDTTFTTSPVNFSKPVVGLFRGPVRKIAKVPFKVLDAPQLMDDFYVNLLDWSSSNVLGVGLGSAVYLWNAQTSKVTKLVDYAAEDKVTSISWSQKGVHLAIGTDRGEVQIWDVTAGRKLRTMTGHQGRVGAVAWNGYWLATGSRDHQILMRDVRIAEHYTDTLSAHRQEVCGLKWSFEENQLASGGNDNKLMVWNSGNFRAPAIKFSDHQAAVKAIAWSPHQHGLLASGGGTADRCIRFWNTLNASCVNVVDSGSQVCNIAWSKTTNELVSTHGYSLNQVVVWKYPSMTKIATLSGHTFRVLYLAMSPDGQTVVTGAGDETLRFWSLFPPPGGATKQPVSLLGGSFAGFNQIR